MNLLRRMPLGTHFHTNTYADQECNLFDDYRRLLKDHHSLLVNYFDNDNIFKMSHKFVTFEMDSQVKKIEQFKKDFRPNFDTIYFFTHRENIMYSDADPIFEYVPLSYGGDYASMLKFTSYHELIEREAPVFADDTCRADHWTPGLLITFVNHICHKAGLYIEAIEI